MITTMLFLPGNNPSMIANGAHLPTDAVIIDLEDAVSPDQKDAARILAASALEHLDFGEREIIIRINALDTPFWQEDLNVLVAAGARHIIPPKVQGAETIKELCAYLDELENDLSLDIEEGEIKITALIETAIGVEHAYEIATASERLYALFLGGEDLSADLQCARTLEGDEIFYARTRLITAARAAGIHVIDTPFTDVNNLEGLAADTEKAKGLGFTGKAVISPMHLDTIRAIYTPSREEYQKAQEIIKALETAKSKGLGVAKVDGKMVDAPVVKQAERVIDRYRRLSGEVYDA